MSKKTIIGEDGKEYEVKEKKPFYKRWWFIALIILLILGSCSVFLGEDSEETTSKEESEATETVEETSEESEDQEEVETEAPTTPVEIIEVAAQDAFRDDLTEVQVIGNNEDLPIGRINVRSTLPTAFGAEGAVKGFLSDANKFLRDIQDQDYESVFFMVQGDFVDQHGNSKKSNALKMEIEKEEVDKINFEQFDWNQLPNLAKHWEIHPAIEKEID